MKYIIKNLSFVFDNNCNNIVYTLVYRTPIVLTNPI